MARLDAAVTVVREAPEHGNLDAAPETPVRRRPREPGDSLSRTAKSTRPPALVQSCQSLTVGLMQCAPWIKRYLYRQTKSSHSRVSTNDPTNLSRTRVGLGKSLRALTISRLTIITHRARVLHARLHDWRAACLRCLNGN